MIPKPYITAWSKYSPWKSNYLIEQDLIIERAISEIFSHPELRENLAFRGGTAIHKLFFNPQPRYSEDIDLVQVGSGPIGDLLSLIREKLAFLGEAKYNKSIHNNTLTYRFDTEFEPVIKPKLKIEINTREHFSIFGYHNVERKIENEWFSGTSSIKTFMIEELLGTKLRALYQRSKGRDLFDLWYAHTNATLDIPKIIEAFHKYIEHDELQISSREFILCIEEKLQDESFNGDVVGLIRPEIKYDGNEAWNLIKEVMITNL